MSSNFFQKPENALKRSEELISVGQKNSALDVLEAVIKSKRHRQWTPILEDILKKFLSLCTESRQPRRAKEGLIQYRGIAQNHAQGPDSILKVVTSFIGDGEKSVREAEDKAGLGADAVANLQDLEAEETPETMMISVLTGDLSDTGRADRDSYVQWLRFLWESYRTCLEVLKNNPKLEELYADTAKKTFAFCVRYKRKVEFRRLKDLLKTHLNVAQLNHMVTPNSEASLRLRVEVRAEQLNAATKLELWQLAFESAEELHNVISHPANRKAFKSRVMMSYYDKVSQVFWVSENYLFHACAMQRIFHLTERSLMREVARGELDREQAQTQLQMLASKLLLGSISVPLPPQKQLEVDFDPEKDKQQRMATLVGHSTVPQRKAILSDLVSRNITSLVFPELRELLDKLEVEFDPLSLGDQVKPMLAFVEKTPELNKYLEPLKKMVLIKLVQQLSQVYVTMRISDFARLADFMSLHDCEKFIVEAVSRNQAMVRLDHKNGTLNLGDKGLESEGRRSQLTNLAKGLQGTLDLVHQDKQEARAQKAEAFKQLADSLEDERKMMTMRRQQIEERKELVEREMHLKQMEDERRRRMEDEERRKAEEARKEEDKKRREEARAQQEKEEKELAEKKRLKEQVEALKAEEKKGKGKAAAPEAKGAVEEMDENELKNMDKTELIKAKREQEEKLKREAEERIQQQVQKLDHLERARRENERPLLAKVFDEQKEQDKVRWEVESQQFITNHKKKYEEDSEIKKVVVRMLADKGAFETEVRRRREAQYQLEMQEHREHTRREKEQKRRQREEREAREREDSERREREEEEKREREEDDKRRRAEERQRLDAIAEKQRQREAEIEARQRERTGGPSGDSGARPGERGGGDDRGEGRWGGGGGGAGGGGGGEGRWGRPREDRPREEGGRWGGGGGGGDSGRWGDRGDRGGGESRFGDRGDRGGGGGGGDRWGGGDRDREGGGGGGRWGGGGDRGPPRDDRGGDRWGGGGDRDRGEGGGRWGDRGGDRDREGGGGGGGRWGGGGDRGPPREDRGGGDRWGGGGDRGGGDRGDRWGGGDRDRGGGGDRFGGGFGPRRDDGPPRRDDGPPAAGERPRLNLQPRSRPKDEDAKPKSDDGFTTVASKRR